MSTAIHYTVLCERSQAKFEQWQIDTFSAIEQAYLGLKREYETSLQSEDEILADEHPGPQPCPQPRCREALKKFAVSLLTGQQYDWFNAMEQDYASGLPQMDLVDAAAEGRFVRFFEQALEWKHMTYLFYPYFWADKKNWTAVHQPAGHQPAARALPLRAGYARVWVPVRPGFDMVVVSYIEVGGGGPRRTHRCGRGAGLLGSASDAVAHRGEIKEQLGADFVRTRGSSRSARARLAWWEPEPILAEDDVDRGGSHDRARVLPNCRGGRRRTGPDLGRAIWARIATPSNSRLE